MPSNRTADPSGAFSRKALRAKIVNPTQLTDYLSRHRSTGKFRRAGDEQHAEIQGYVRTTIQELEQAENQDAVLNELRAAVEEAPKKDVTTVALWSLVEYVLPKDAQYLSVDRAIQRHLRDHNVEGEEAPAHIKKNGGIAATYAIARAEKHGTAPKPRKPRANLQADIYQACPDLHEGDKVAALITVLKDKKLSLVKAQKFSPSTDGANTQSDAGDSAGTEFDHLQITQVLAPAPAITAP